MSAPTGTWRIASALAFIAGFVDTAGFVGLFGLFTAHVTGNFVLIGASIAGSGTGYLGKLMALPVFCIAVALTTLYVQRRTGDPAKPVLLAQAVLLAAFMTAGLVLAPFTAGDQPMAIVTGMLGVAAMGVQNAASRSVFSSLSPTTVMTGNVTQIVMDLVGPHDEATAARIRKMAPPVAAFALGAVGGGIGFMRLGFLCLLVPIAVVLVGMALVPRPER